MPRAKVRVSTPTGEAEFWVEIVGPVLGMTPYSDLLAVYDGTGLSLVINKNQIIEYERPLSTEQGGS
jgi:hypothetical protein